MQFPLKYHLFSVIVLLQVLFTINCFAQDSSLLHRKIPIDAKRWYQLTNATNGLEQLFDGNLTTDVNTGFGKIISYYEAYYPLIAGESITIDSIRLYDWQGNNSVPMMVYAIDSNWNRQLIATFTGNQYATWVGPYPTRTGVIKLDMPVKNIQLLLIKTGDGYPTEMEFYGYYKKPSAITPMVKKQVKLKDVFAINGYEWNFLNALTNPYIIDEKRFANIKTFSGVRHYMDWQKLEDTKGSYTFSPTRSGGWNYDTIYQRCKAEGIMVLACLKTIPNWIENTYPNNLKDGENTPLRYGADLTSPASYIEQAQVAFQYIARYGSNANINPALLSVNTTQRWTGDDINTIRTGLGLIKYIECDNERDKWWKGRKAYQTGREYAANLSAFYDGHKNTLGQGVGVKNADSTIKVVMAGVALANTDYFRGMIDWCKEFRGYKQDGSVNLCWDIINYHLYTNDGSLRRGVAPEKKTPAINADSIAKAFINAAHIYANDMPVWVTEAGYDINQGSPNKSIAISSKSILQTQADWILRTSLLYARNGIEKVFFYQLHDDTPGFGGLYSTSGLINEDETRRPAADFIYQANKLFGNYTYKQTLNTDPIVDQYTFQDTLSMHVVFIPDEVGRTGSYLLDLNNADTALIYTPTAASNEMTLRKQRTINGKIAITATETPVFIIGKGIATAQQEPISSIKLFPNPATDKLIIDGLTVGEKTQISLLSNSGKPIKTVLSNNTRYEMNITEIAPELYYVHIYNKTTNTIIPFIKSK